MISSATIQVVYPQTLVISVVACVTSDVHSAHGLKKWSSWADQAATESPG